MVSAIALTFVDRISIEIGTRSTSINIRTTGFTITITS